MAEPGSPRTRQGIDGQGIDEQRINEHGQAIGRPVPGWAPRPRPAPVTLTGRYVTVTPVGSVDPGELFAALRDPAVWTYRPEEPPVDAGEVAERMAAWSASSAAVTFALVVDGVPSGIASLMRIDEANGVVEVGGIIYGPRLARTRAATEVIALFAGHVFHDLGYRRFEWKLDSRNAASFAAAGRLGFGYEGRFRQALVYKGRNRDTDWFAMTDGDWALLRPAYDAWLDPANFDGAGQQLRRLSELTAAALGR